MGTENQNKHRFNLLILALIPITIVTWVWLSALAFVPVPWPDDSAFYFVAKDFFKWPPRWVMLPQAPFEPTYRIFNFNTMPLYPVLIGIGRWFGIDGSFLLKLWPLSAWAFSGSLLVTTLYRKGLPFFACAILGFVFALDPEMRWASVLVRPESLIGLLGVALVLGLSCGFPEKLRPRKLWDPVAALLALGAYAHFNAIHLIFPVLFAFYSQPKRLFSVGIKTALYLAPWFGLVIFHWELFVQQMSTQWIRLAVPNSWLNSPREGIRGLFQALGSPEPWPEFIYWAGTLMWVLIGISLLSAVFYLFLKYRKTPSLPQINLLPSVGWILGAIWIFYSKPEVWFIYYLHIALWTFTGIFALWLWKSRFSIRIVPQMTLTFAWVFLALLFGYLDVTQSIRLKNTSSWHWSTYQDFVNCIDQHLTSLQSRPNSGKPFQVWDPTFPDITIELSRKHPDWEFTRTNDFHQRNHLAIQHGWNVDAVVVTETINWEERTISEKAEHVPYISSTWMNWTPYFLNQLWKSPGWKPNRYVCQRGRWQAFIFSN
jgi:hypothetical protein